VVAGSAVGDQVCQETSYLGEAERDQSVPFAAPPFAVLLALRAVTVRKACAHIASATLRVGDVFLKIDADQTRTDVEVEAMAMAPIPTPGVLWRKPGVPVALGVRRALERPRRAYLDGYVTTLVH